jgi:hypothetical protein
MAGTNKTLTVSYGTFSCTLEGFEDSFGTMRAIAEYFRQLAAEDRFFGAEPPSPDAAAIQTIAERTSRRRIESRFDNHGVVLRPAAGPDVEDQLIAAALGAHEDGGPTAEHRRSVPPEPESVAAKLARIRAVVDRARATAPASGARPLFEQRPSTAPDPGTAFALSGGAGRQDEFTEDLDPCELDAPGKSAWIDGHLSPSNDTAPVGPSDRQGPLGQDGEEGKARPDAAEAAPDRALPGAGETENESEVETPRRPRARVLKLRRADLAEGWRPAQSPETGLPDSLEAELQAELAEIQAEAAQSPEPEAAAPPQASPVKAASAPGQAAEQPPEASGPAPAEALGPPRAEAGPPLPFGPAQDEADLLRLLDEANSKLAGPEHQRRRTAISHLKAAVAATVADGKLEPGNRSDEEERRKRPYRQVLAKVVRGAPERPRGAPVAGPTRLAPLVLVSELRVDLPQTDPRARDGVIRPGPAEGQRPSFRPADYEDDAADNIFDAGTSFEEFAAGRAAQDVTDLLEAAAEYLLTRQAQRHFSRPDVVDLALGQLGEAATRDDVLRAFGSLLRDGTFREVGGGGDFVMPGIGGKDIPEARRRQA